MSRGYWPDPTEFADEARNVRELLDQKPVDNRFFLRIAFGLGIVLALYLLLIRMAGWLLVFQVKGEGQ